MPMPNQQVKMLIATIIMAGRPVLDVSLYTIATRVKLHEMQDTAVGILFAYIGQVSWSYTSHPQISPRASHGLLDFLSTY